jgi:3-hydroxyisobutyrate dehydrogenase-like beta-hydroxyacid dehydrogenase
VLTSTVAPNDAIKLDKALKGLNKGLNLIDAPISGGPSRSATGDLCIMASGESSALSNAHAVLSTLSQTAGTKENLHFIRKLAIVSSLSADEKRAESDREAR